MKPDFEAASERWTRFWQGQRLERPLAGLRIPRPGIEPLPKPKYAPGVSGSFEEIAESVLKWASSYEYIGDAVPYYYAEFGPDHFSALLGAELRFHPDSPETSWCVPFVKDWDDAYIRFRPDCFWWEQTVEFFHALRRRTDGRMMIAAPTLSGGLDCLAAIRGVNELLMDIITVPDKIKRALDAACNAYKDTLAAVAEELNYREFGSITRHGMYCRGKTSVPQCDFSCMISPEMFKDFQVPCIERETELLDAAEYHLDGPGALPHLEALCNIDGIDVIQWVAGAGEAAEKNWWDLYEKIDSLGKGQILWPDNETIKKMCREFKSSKLFFLPSAKTRKEAEAFLD